MLTSAHYPVHCSGQVYPQSSALWFMTQERYEDWNQSFLFQFLTRPAAIFWLYFKPSLGIMMTELRINCFLIESSNLQSPGGHDRVRFMRIIGIRKKFVQISRTAPFIHYDPIPMPSHVIFVSTQVFWVLYSFQVQSKSQFMIWSFVHLPASDCFWFASNSYCLCLDASFLCLSYLACASFFLFLAFIFTLAHFLYF